MKKIKSYLRGFFLGFFLMFEGLGKAMGTAMSSLQDKIISKEQEVPELSTPEKFRYYTGVLGYHQRLAKDRGDEETVQAIEDDLWEMAFAYKNGKLEEYLYKKTKTSIYYDIEIDEETGQEKVTKVNTEDGTREEIETGVARQQADSVEILNK